MRTIYKLPLVLFMLSLVTSCRPDNKRITTLAVANPIDYPTSSVAIAVKSEGVSSVDTTKSKLPKPKKFKPSTKAKSKKPGSSKSDKSVPDRDYQEGQSNLGQYIKSNAVDGEEAEEFWLITYINERKKEELEEIFSKYIKLESTTPEEFIEYCLDSEVSSGDLQDYLKDNSMNNPKKYKYRSRKKPIKISYTPAQLDSILFVHQAMTMANKVKKHVLYCLNGAIHGYQKALFYFLFPEKFFAKKTRKKKKKAKESKQKFPQPQRIKITKK